MLQTLAAVIESQIKTCQEVLQLEQQINHVASDRSGEKWPLLTLARLKEVQQQLAEQTTANVSSEVQQIYQTLLELDPMRRGYYLDAMQGRAAQVTRSLNSDLTAVN